MRKQLDPRLPLLITNNVQKNHRSFIVIVGDKGRDQIVNLHYLLSQARVSARPSVLWCYNKELGFTTHRKKREAKIKRDVKRGIREPNEQNPFEIFVSVTDIRYAYYKDSHKILGSTYGMLVLQDFEALTPNLLARTVETVEGGGVIVMLLKTMSSLRQLYSMSMDVHSRYRSNIDGQGVVGRFNERFILSLSANPDCLFLDDELNVLPISRGKDIIPYEVSSKPATSIELKELQDSMEGTTPLISLAKTIDQATALLTFIDALTSQSLSTTVTLTASRGRGKSAALGIAIAAALGQGYSNVFVTSPSPDNLKTVFEFIFKGMDKLGYEEGVEYSIRQSEFEESKAVVRIDVFKGHRQTVQYIHPADAHVLGQAELLVIDEAAAIPLPLIRSLLGVGSYVVFLSSTVSGYEGTGRALKLKLIKGLRDAANGAVGASKDGETKIKSTGKRTLRELKLNIPIRYGADDEVEKWLNSILCLDAGQSDDSTILGSLPHPKECTLYHVSRDTLFSFHPASEAFLHRMMALFVASHYKNQPNDLMMMSDKGGVDLWVLLPPLGTDDSDLPHPLAVIQTTQEGRIPSSDVTSASINRSTKADGDLIPWLVSQQYQEPRFAEMIGVRVVRVAVREGLGSMGYGSRAIKCLHEFYRGEYVNLEESESEKVYEREDKEDDIPRVRSASNMPPLLRRLAEVKPPAGGLDWIGVSYGLTGPLLRYWKRLGYTPLYVRHTPNDLTGEHSCVMVRTLEESKDAEWLGEFASDFRTRFLTLLSFPKFRDFGSAVALSILEAVNSCEAVKTLEAHGGSGRNAVLKAASLPLILSPYDLKRLEAYGNNQLDYHVILDLVPIIASLFFQRRLALPDSSEHSQDVRLSALQSAIFLGAGLQRKSVEDVESELSLPVNQVLAYFVKVIRKITKRLIDIQKEAVQVDLQLPSAAGPRLDIPVPRGANENDEDEDANEEKRQKQRELIDSLDLNNYAINDTAIDWTEATKGGARSIVSVKTGSGVKRKVDADGENAKGTDNKKPTRRSKKVKR